MPLINALNSLQEDGLQIFINNKHYNIFFITNLVIGDNLRVNSIFGFVESFALTFYYLMCYMHSNDAKISVKENTNLLRNKVQYEKDIKSLNHKQTGIKGKCIFKCLKNFHCIENYSIDLMHDFFEGVCNYDISNLLLTFIVE